MSETVLVTGGTGYIAGWCIVKLLERGFDVRTTVGAWLSAVFHKYANVYSGLK